MSQESYGWIIQHTAESLEKADAMALALHNLIAVMGVKSPREGGTYLTTALRALEDYYDVRHR